MRISDWSSDVCSSDLTLCPSCKTPGTLDSTQWDQLAESWKLPKPDEVQFPNGCLECRNTGYRGRSGIYEMLTISPGLKKLITQDADLAKIKHQAYKEGMQPLLINGEEKIATGLTTPEIGKETRRERMGPDV